MSYIQRIIAPFAIVFALLFSFTAASDLVGLTPRAEADTSWKCWSYENWLFGDSGFCTEVVYTRKDMGKWCKIKADKVGFYITDDHSGYKDPAARIYSLDLVSGSGRFLFNRDDVAVQSDSSHNGQRWWDPRGSWKARSIRITTHALLRMRGPEPDHRALTAWTIGPYNRNCQA